MHDYLPERLISSEAKAKVIIQNTCDKCELLRRTDLRTIYTPGGEISSDIWASKEIFELSVNIYLCNTDSLSIESERTDVRYYVDDDIPFHSDQQVIDLKLPVQANVDQNAIIVLKYGELSDMKGTFPFKKNTPEETFYNYRLVVKYDPMVLNAFHFNVNVESKESEEAKTWNKLDRNTKKKYIRSLASDIRNKIIDEKLAKELTL